MHRPNRSKHNLPADKPILEQDSRKQNCYLSPIRSCLMFRLPESIVGNSLIWVARMRADIHGLHRKIRDPLRLSVSLKYLTLGDPWSLPELKQNL
jgi:hypothetical protein